MRGDFCGLGFLFQVLGEVWLVGFFNIVFLLERILNNTVLKPISQSEVS